MHLWDFRRNEAFTELKHSLINSLFMAAPDWSRPFRCHFDASQFAVGSILTHLDASGREHPIAYFSKRISSADGNYFANNLELFGLVYFLQRFQCCLEGANFEMLNDNRILRSFLSKPAFNRREPRRLKFLRQFGFTSLTLVERKIHVLGDALSRSPHVTSFPAVYVSNTTAKSLSF